MELQAEYGRLILSSLNRGLDKSKLGFYTEIHHIVPKCMGGSDELSNLVLLSGREHFLAHKLLSLINPSHYGLKMAWWNMCTRNDCLGRNYIITSEEYEEAKISFANAHKVRWANPEFRDKVVFAQRLRWKETNHFC